MEHLSNPAGATFEKLREIGYNEEILKAVENENFLSLIGNELLKDKKAAEELLYACVNDKKAIYFPVYKCLQEEVQIQLLTERDISDNILQETPEIIENTPLASDRNAILNNISGKPEIAQYISEDLVKNPEFMNEMISREPKALITIFNNPSLANNPQFMIEAISKDVNSIKYMSKEMLNNYEVFREAAQNNKEVIDYAILNSEELGLNAIMAVSDVSKENVKQVARDAIDEDIRNNENSKLKDWDKDQKRYEEMNGKEPNAIRDAAMISQADKIADEQALERYKEQLKAAQLAVIKIERSSKEEPNYEISISDLAVISRIGRIEEHLAEFLHQYPEFKQVIEECKEKYAEFKEIRKEQGQERSKLEAEKKFKLSNEIEKRVKSENKSKEHNAELSVDIIAFSPEDRKIGRILDYLETASLEVSLTPEQMRQNQIDLDNRNDRITIKKEEPKRGIEALQKQSEEKTAPGM